MDENQSNSPSVEDSDRVTASFISSAPSRTPKSIGRYHIKRVLATGGMGTVYEAVQEKPRRTVAVKVMKHGVASRGAMRRFEYESQLLGRLRHPGIAQIYEAGTHDDGTGPVPFFAMEYIGNAKPITQYANDKNLDTRARLELFMRVCAAAHHGHQKGIIHRDLKPSNILVDSNGNVKIIDFGVARGTDSDLAVTTAQTDIGQLIGTLQYMSPEQCEADPNDIDTRSDVYSMGVVLYELLSGRPPYEVSRAKIYDGTRAIRENQPTSLSSIDSTLKGDVETVVLKALEKDRDRRYQSAAEMGADIQRYLNGEAIIARPPSMAYQLRVFARRNKPMAAAVAAVILALAIGLVSVSVAYLRVQHARASAEREQRLRIDAERYAERSRAEAEALRDLSDRIGFPAPEFSTTTLDGNLVGSGTYGKHPATVLNFVAANCPFSTRKVTELCNLREAYGERGVRFVNIAQTFKGKQYSASDVMTMFTGEGWDWELVYDASNSIGKLFRIRGYPKLVVIDRQGTIVDAGTFRANYLDDRLAKLVGERPKYETDSVESTSDRKAKLAALEDLWRRRLAVQRRMLGKDSSEAIYNLAELLRAQGKVDEAERLYRESLKSFVTLAGADSSLSRSVLESLVDLLESEGRTEEADALIAEPPVDDNGKVAEGISDDSPSP